MLACAWERPVSRRLILDPHPELVRRGQAELAVHQVDWACCGRSTHRRAHSLTWAGSRPGPGLASGAPPGPRACPCDSASARSSGLLGGGRGCGEQRPAHLVLPEPSHRADARGGPCKHWFSPSSWSAWPSRAGEAPPGHWSTSAMPCAWWRPSGHLKGIGAAAPVPVGGPGLRARRGGLGFGLFFLFLRYAAPRACLAQRMSRITCCSTWPQEPGSGRGLLHMHVGTGCPGRRHLDPLTPPATARHASGSGQVVAIDRVRRIIAPRPPEVDRAATRCCA